MAAHFSILAWRIPLTEVPGRLWSTDHRELDTTEQRSTGKTGNVLQDHGFPGIQEFESDPILSQPEP